MYPSPSPPPSFLPRPTTPKHPDKHLCDWNLPKWLVCLQEKAHGQSGAGSGPSLLIFLFFSFSTLIAHSQTLWAVPQMGKTWEVRFGAQEALRQWRQRRELRKGDFRQLPIGLRGAGV